MTQIKVGTDSGDIRNIKGRRALLVGGYVMRNRPAPLAIAAILAASMVASLLAFSSSARAGGAFDGRWRSTTTGSLGLSATFRTLGPPRCGPGDFALTIRNSQAVGVTHKMIFEAREEHSAVAAMNAFTPLFSSPNAISVVMYGHFLQLSGRIRIAGSITETGEFSGTIGTIPFSGRFVGDNFTGAIDPIYCSAEIRLQRVRK